MKKIIFALVCMVMSISANAHIFDGIDLNGDLVKVTRAISQKGYVTDPVKGCLKGNCQGTEIYLTINSTDSSHPRKLGQLIIDVPMNNADALANATLMFNVIYHQIGNVNGVVMYDVNEDGTTMSLEKTATGLRLCYNTPFYEKK